MALTNRLAIIVGGLGGLGSTTGMILRAQGARLALLYAPFEADRSAELLHRGYGLSAPTDDVRTYACDITSPASVQSAFSSISSDVSAAAGGGGSSPTSPTAGPAPPGTAGSLLPPAAFPSILVNAAGYVSLSAMEDTPPEETVKHLHINVLGPMLCSQAFARLYLAAYRASAASSSSTPPAPSSSPAAPPSSNSPPSPPPGRIVNIASQAAHVALDRHSAYCASKAALLGLTRSMASEWGPRGITANSVSPTVAWTELGRKAWGTTPGVADEFLRQVPAGRFVLPEEVGEAVAFLCGDGAGMINGADLRIDGGYTIR